MTKTMKVLDEFIDKVFELSRENEGHEVIEDIIRYGIQQKLTDIEDGEREHEAVVRDLVAMNNKLNSLGGMSDEEVEEYIEGLRADRRFL